MQRLLRFLPQLLLHHVLLMPLLSLPHRPSLLPSLSLLHRPLVPPMLPLLVQS